MEPRCARVPLLLLAALTLATLALRLTGLGFGVPIWEEPDPDIPGHVDLLRSGSTLAGVEHPELQYPHLIADVARFLPARPPASGEGAPRELGEHLGAAAWTHVQVRALVAVIASALVPITFLLARRFVSGGWALFAAALVATSLLHQSFAQQARPHGAAATFFALAVLADLRLARDGRVRSYWLAGLATALALGTLHSAVALAIPGLAAHAFRDGGGRRFLTWRLALPIAIAAAAVAAFYPFLFSRAAVDPSQPTQVAGGAVRFAEHAVSLVQFTGRGFPVVLEVLWNYEPLLTSLLPLALLAWIAGRKRESADRTRRGERLVALSFSLPYLAAIGLFDLTYERFVLPLIPFLAVFVAAGAESLSARLAGRAARIALATACTIALGLPAAACARLAYLRSRPDTLGEAAAWIEIHAPAERVYVSASQPLDLPIFREREGLRPFGHAQITPWTRWQDSVPEAGAPAERRDVRWLAAPARGGTLAEHVDSLAPALFVIEAYEQRANHPQLVELRRALAARGEPVARFSPDVDPGASELELFFQLSDHFNDGEQVDWPHFAARLLRADAIGPVVEIWRVERR